LTKCAFPVYVIDGNDYSIEPHDDNGIRETDWYLIVTILLATFLGATTSPSHTLRRSGISVAQKHRLHPPRNWKR